MVRTAYDSCLFFFIHEKEYGKHGIKHIRCGSWLVGWLVGYSLSLFVGLACCAGVSLGSWLIHGIGVDTPPRYSKKRENDHIRILCYFITLLYTFSYLARVDSVSLCYRATGSCVSYSTPTHTITSDATYRDPSVIHRTFQCALFCV